MPHGRRPLVSASAKRSRPRRRERGSYPTGGRRTRSSAHRCAVHRPRSPAPAWKTDPTDFRPADAGLDVPRPQSPRHWPPLTESIAHWSPAIVLINGCSLWLEVFGEWLRRSSHGTLTIQLRSTRRRSRWGARRAWMPWGGERDTTFAVEPYRRAGRRRARRHARGAVALQRRPAAGHCHRRSPRQRQWWRRGPRQRAVRRPERAWCCRRAGRSGGLRNGHWLIRRWSGQEFRPLDRRLWERWWLRNSRGLRNKRRRRWRGYRWPRRRRAGRPGRSHRGRHRATPTSGGPGPTGTVGGGTGGPGPTGTDTGGGTGPGEGVGGTPPDGPGSGPGTPSNGGDTAAARSATPDEGTHGDRSEWARLNLLFGVQTKAEPPGIDATQAGPDLTHQQERALIAEGWRGAP